MVRWTILYTDNIYFKHIGPGRTGQIFVYFVKKSVTSSPRQVRPAIFRSTKFCQGLPNFKHTVVLPRSRTNFCQAWNLTDLSIYTPRFEGKCQSRKFDLYFQLQAIAFISVWLTLVFNNLFCCVSVRPLLTNFKFGRDDFCRDFWKGQTNFVNPVRPDP